MIHALLLALLAPPAVAAAPPQDGRRGDWMQAYDARRGGRLMRLPEIERRVVPTMGGAQYLGCEFDSDRGIYTLKFLRDGAVIWVDVDGRSGQVIGRTGR